jgi:hypothetical protein
VLAIITVPVAIAGLSSLLLAAESRGLMPRGDFSPRHVPVWTLSGPEADDIRRDALLRATARAPEDAASHPPISLDDMVICRFLRAAPTGTSAKFDCVLEGGEVVKIKYGRNPEIQAEAAATRLISTLGFAADDVQIVPRLRCYGCPRFPFFVMRLQAGIAGTLIGERGYEDRYTDFEWVALERRFPAPAIDTPTHDGWAWWELRESTAPRDEIDALRLLAVFLGHWDNKPENQRLVCLDELTASDDRACARPLAMMQDLGATFGPNKMNLARWSEFPVWSDTARCEVSLRQMPYGAGTFPDLAISEEGRIWLGRRLAMLSDDDVRSLFESARFPAYHSGTDDRRDLDAWSAAFRHRVDQIVNAGPCPA